MDATPEQIEALVKLQNIDMTCARLNKQLDELPQKRKIAEARSKKATLAKKRATVVGMRKDAETSLAHAQGEDADLERKQGVAQSLINAAPGDFRAVTAHSKELEGYAKRREALAEEIATLQDKLAEIGKVESDIDTLSAALEKKESQFIASYRKEGGDLLRTISTYDPERTQLCQIVGPQILSVYERIAKAKGGVAFGELKDSSCSVCRSTFDTSRMLALRADAPLTTCPQCGRLLFVDKAYKG